jgi:formamidopyrimidine-DNA glycosylase
VPELIEVEQYRQLAQRAVGRTIVAVDATDAWFLKGGASTPQVVDALVGARWSGTARRGKLLTVDLGSERPTLGLRFGMTGRLVLDHEAPIAKLEYASGRDDPAWDRFVVHFGDGGRLRLSDPRRLGGVELDPHIDALGPDAASVSLSELRVALANSQAPLKARLLDQARLAGLGNLLVDETLWRARLDPARPAGGLADAEVRRLRRRIVDTVADLSERGGSHTGDLQEHRHRSGRCPRCGAPLARTTVGGRTTYACRPCFGAAARGR